MDNLKYFLGTIKIIISLWSKKLKMEDKEVRNYAWQ